MRRPLTSLGNTFSFLLHSKNSQSNMASGCSKINCPRRLTSKTLCCPIRKWHPPLNLPKTVVYIVWWVHDRWLDLTTEYQTHSSNNGTRVCWSRNRIDSKASIYQSRENSFNEEEGLSAQRHLKRWSLLWMVNPQSRNQIRGIAY